ncbi:RHS repeat domain-containing protein [Taibaiella koreensis]|uniref:RHS repeat domain-containing protein n=1 Tax=Taibaiella koreensis TaxID=1268548 RepID=UPI000E5A0070|nr:RHS repeat domain-containing protein [Taibaiella koreensis]
MKRSFIRIIGLVLSFAGGTAVHGQTSIAAGLGIAVNQPSENAAALTRGGIVPVNFSTGQPNISIPLHTVSYYGINIPIGLNYDASGVRVDQHPTWVGLNWNLQAGVISRSVKGMPDDYVFPDRNGQHFANMEKGFLFCGNKLNTADWNTEARLLTFAPYFDAPSHWNPEYLADGMPDDYNFSFGGYSGTLFMDEQGIWRVRSQSNLGLEVSHEVNDEPVTFDSGSVTRMRINKMITQFTITTPDGLKYIFGGDLNAIDYSRGGNDNFNLFNDKPGDVFNISPTAWYLTRIISPQGVVINFNYERGYNLVRYYRTLSSTTYSTMYSSGTTTPVTLAASVITPCYLKSIETPLQDITFNRSQSVQQVFDSVTWDNGSPQPVDLDEFDKTIWAVKISSQYTGWPDFTYPRHAHVWQPWPRSRIADLSPKLDSIIVADKKGAVQKTIRFGYNNIATERLFLNTVTIAGNNGENEENYAFDYYSKEQVPKYRSLMKDQWGYYNGVNFTAGSLYSNTAWRLPSLPLAMIGNMKSITYPTGGKATFEYELNNYAQFQKVTVNNQPGATYGTVSLENAGSNTNAGGLRIKTITVNPGYSSPVITKSYYYTKNFIGGGTTSSGILSGRSKYIEQSRFVNFCAPNGSYLSLASDNEFNPFGEDVKSVTYGEVTEVSSDGSKTVYRYSNYDDPGCMDEIGDRAFFINVYESDLYKLSSNSLERGLLLSEINYNSANQKVRDKVYEYDLAADRKQKFGKGIQRFDRFKEHQRETLYGRTEACADYNACRLYSYRKYYYNVPLKKVTETLYQGTTPISTAQSFTYDAYGNIASTTSIGSDGVKTEQTVSYNSAPGYQSNNAADPSAAALRITFANLRIKNLPVEKVTYRMPADVNAPPDQKRIIDASLYQYHPDRYDVASLRTMELSEPLSALAPNYTPAAVTGAGTFTFDSHYKLQDSMLYAPDLIGAPTRAASVWRPSGPNESYTWDYNNGFATSVTRGAVVTQDAYAYTGFEGHYEDYNTNDNKGNWRFNPASILRDGGGATGKAYYQMLPSGGPTNIVSSRSIPKAGSNYILSFWSAGTNPVVSRGGTTVALGQALRTLNNTWKYYECLIPGDGVNAVTISGPAGGFNIFLDDVRLYPAEASMTNYTYDPATGNVTSVGDDRGKITFYDYDSFGRLLLVKDQDGNIVKKHTYNYQTPQ